MYFLQEIIQTQALNPISFWIIFIFFICLSMVFILKGKGNKEMMLLHMLIMCISVLIAGLVMLQYDLLFTLCFILFQVISWVMNLLMTKL